MVTTWGHWIDGRSDTTPATRFLDVRPPVSEEPVGRLVDGGERAVDLAVRSARAAQPAWAALAPAARGEVLVHLASEIDRQAEDLARLERLETGKREAVVRDEIAGTADYFRFYGQAVRTTGGHTFEAGAGRHLYLQREPYGVVGILTPWNYAVNQAARGAAPALAAGNSVVLKPSEFASTTVVALARLASDAGLPPGVLDVVLGGGATGAALVSHPGVDKVSFTGSVATGRRVAVAAAQRLVPVTLELGGKSPHLVFADADLPAAAIDVADAAYYNAGQTCSAGSRLLVEASVHDEFAALVVEAAQSHRPARGGGPIITRPQCALVLEHLRDAEREGAVPLLGGLAAQASGELPFLEPTVYVGVTPGMHVFREEVFGPVLTVTAFADEGEALALADDTDFGLVAGVWTRDLDRSFRVARRLVAGQVYVNGWGAPIEVPFGGVRLSGFGREKGLAALEEYSRAKGIAFTLQDHT